LNRLKGQWPVFVFALMFCVLPLATIPGLFDFVFVILGGFTLVIMVLIVISLYTSRMKRSDSQ